MASLENKLRSIFLEQAPASHELYEKLKGVFTPLTDPHKRAGGKGTGERIEIDQQPWSHEDLIAAMGVPIKAIARDKANMFKGTEPEDIEAEMLLFLWDNVIAADAGKSPFLNYARTKLDHHAYRYAKGKRGRGTFSVPADPQQDYVSVKAPGEVSAYDKPTGGEGEGGYLISTIAGAAERPDILQDNKEIVSLVMDFLDSDKFIDSERIAIRLMYGFDKIEGDLPDVAHDYKDPETGEIVKRQAGERAPEKWADLSHAPGVVVVKQGRFGRTGEYQTGGTEEYAARGLQEVVDEINTNEEYYKIFHYDYAQKNRSEWPGERNTTVMTLEPVEKHPELQDKEFVQQKLAKKKGVEIPAYLVTSKQIMRNIKNGVLLKLKASLSKYDNPEELLADIKRRREEEEADKPINPQVIAQVVDRLEAEKPKWTGKKWEEDINKIIRYINCSVVMEQLMALREIID